MSMPSILTVPAVRERVRVRARALCRIQMQTNGLQRLEEKKHYTKHGKGGQCVCHTHALRTLLLLRRGHAAAAPRHARPASPASSTRRRSASMTLVLPAPVRPHTPTFEPPGMRALRP